MRPILLKSVRAVLPSVQELRVLVELIVRHVSRAVGVQCVQLVLIVLTTVAIIIKSAKNAKGILAAGQSAMTTVFTIIAGTIPNALKRYVTMRVTIFVIDVTVVLPALSRARAGILHTLV